MPHATAASNARAAVRARPRLAMALLAVAAMSLLPACRDTRTVSVSGDPRINDTTSLGAGSASTPGAPLHDAQGRAVPQPPVPAGSTAQVAPVGRDMVLALWVEGNRVMATRHVTGAGWEPAQPLEAIFGQASDVQLAANENGIAMAVWGHTVGAIRSLRYSRYEAGRGWSTPDVVPGALPRARPSGATAARPQPETAPRLTIDAHGNARAEWPSGFADGHVQTSRYVAGHGWSDSLTQAAAPAAPVAPAPRPAP